MSDQSQDYEPNFVYDYGPEKPKHSVEPKTESKSAGDNWWGIVLVGIGLYFLLSSLNIIPNDFNWWALFIVFPGLAMLLKSWSAYNRAGFLPDDIKSEAVSGFLVLFVGLVFLFDISWGYAWPIILIICGVAIVSGWWGDDDEKEDKKNKKKK